MPTYEVFLKRDGKDEYRHAGALDAANDDLAATLARECYVRRAEGDRIWLVDRANLIQPDAGYLADNADKPHRHHDGEAVAARRKAMRRQAADAPGTGQDSGG
jgi:ring-1,2-phenylacetyl-CoA epoxidase subunit PaaB